MTNTKKIIIILIFILLGLGVYFLLPGKGSKMNNMVEDEQLIKNLIIRQPAVAGQFYPVDKSELQKMIQDFLDEVDILEIGDTPRILIVPHAGYIYSGSTAAKGFKSLQGRDYERVILLGNSHVTRFKGLKLDGSDVWQTPLGQVEVDKIGVEKLVKSDKISLDSGIHLDEHSLEVEVPFLQSVLGNNFKLIPGLFGSDKNLEDLKNIAGSLADLMDDKTLVVISTDLSHYPNTEDANEVDRQTIDNILAGDVNVFLSLMERLEGSVDNLSTCACAWPAVIVGMELAQQLDLGVEFLDYTNSGDIPIYGDKERVVGYTSIIYTTNKKQLTTNNKDMLNEQEQIVALKLARSVLDRAFDKDTSLDEEYKKYSIFNEKRGVFVTLHKKGELRGCIGLIETPDISLSEALSEMTLSAAFNDSRFAALEADELPFIEIEISVLSVPQKVESADKIELGKHGVIVRSGWNSGVFLPQVAVETGWSKEEFLRQLCTQKAGLSPNCWQDKNVDVYTFEAQVFGEK